MTGYYIISNDSSTEKESEIVLIIKSEIKYSEIDLNVKVNTYNIEYKAICQAVKLKIESFSPVILLEVIQIKSW